MNEDRRKERSKTFVGKFYILGVLTRNKGVYHGVRCHRHIGKRKLKGYHIRYFGGHF